MKILKKILNRAFSQDEKFILKLSQDENIHNEKVSLSQNKLYWAKTLPEARKKILQKIGEIHNEKNAVYYLFSGKSPPVKTMGGCFENQKPNPHL